MFAERVHALTESLEARMRAVTLSVNGICVRSLVTARRLLGVTLRRVVGDLLARPFGFGPSWVVHLHGVRFVFQPQWLRAMSLSHVVPLMMTPLRRR